MSATQQAEFGTCHECWALHSGIGMVCDACRAVSQQCHCRVCLPNPPCACGDCPACRARKQAQSTKGAP